MPRRPPPRCSSLAASRTQAPGPPRARLSRGQELEPHPLAVDPRAAVRSAPAAARVRGHGIRPGASPGTASGARQGARGRGRHRPLSGARGLAPLLSRDRYAVGDHPPGRGRGLSPMPPAARTHGVPRARAGARSRDGRLDEVSLLLINPEGFEIREGLLEDVGDERGEIGASPLFFGEEGREYSVDGDLIIAFLLPIRIRGEVLCKLGSFFRRGNYFHCESPPGAGCGAQLPEDNGIMTR